MFSRGNGGWTASKSEHPCSCQNCSKWPPAEKTGSESLLNRLSCPLSDPICHGTELFKEKGFKKNSVFFKRVGLSSGWCFKRDFTVLNFVINVNEVNFVLFGHSL